MKGNNMKDVGEQLMTRNVTGKGPSAEYLSAKCTKRLLLGDERTGENGKLSYLRKQIAFEIESGNTEAALKLRDELNAEKQNLAKAEATLSRFAARTAKDVYETDGGYRIERHYRNWNLFRPDGTLVCQTVYLKGAFAVAQELCALSRAAGREVA